METSIREMINLEQDPELKDNDKKVINIFLASIDDWPNPTLTIESYERDLEDFINNKTTQSNLLKRLKKIDFNKNSWQAESISQIVGIFKFYPKGFSLQEVIQNLKKKVL